MKAEIYVFLLLFISALFFLTVANWLNTGTPYTDVLLTIAVVHFVMSNLITIKKIEG